MLQRHSSRQHTGPRRCAAPRREQRHYASCMQMRQHILADRWHSAVDIATCCMQNASNDEEAPPSERLLGDRRGHVTRRWCIGPAGARAHPSPGPSLAGRFSCRYDPRLVRSPTQPLDVRRGPWRSGVPREIAPRRVPRAASDSAYGAANEKDQRASLPGHIPCGRVQTSRNGETSLTPTS